MNILRSIITLCLSILLTSYALQTTAQPPDAVTQYYVSESGKLYWPADKPVYLFVSDAPDGARPQRLKSDSSNQYADPFFLDTEGVNYIRTKWAVDPETKKYVLPMREVVFEIYRDGTTPATDISLTGANSFNKEGVQYYGKNLQLSLSSKDQLSGSRVTYVSANGSDFQPYSTALKLEENKPYTFKYYTVDNVGNRENTKERSFIVDVVAPTTEIEFTGDRRNNIFSPRAKFSLKAMDTGSGVKALYYSIDGGQEKRFYNEVPLKDLVDGDHKVSFYSIDQVGNKEEVKTMDFYLDKTAPEVKATVVGDQYQNRGRVFVSVRTKVKLEVSDNKAGVKKVWYKIDDNPERPYVEPFELPQSKGKHVIMYYATDNVNNNFKSLFDESASDRSSLDIDMVAPEISYNFKGKMHVTRDTSFITSETKIDLGAVDDDSGVKKVGYKINGGKGIEYVAPFNIPEEGRYVIDFYGMDQVNNRNSKEFFFIVDNTGPEIETILSSDPIGSISLDDKDSDLKVYSSGVKLYLGATDMVVNTAAIYYQINDGKEVEYSGPIAIKQKGIVTYKVRAVDDLGNESTSETFEIFIK